MIQLPPPPSSDAWNKLSTGAPPTIASRCPPIYPTILSHIGNTPLVRCDKLAKHFGLECTLLAKCEFFNAGGSVKDRIGARMVEDAEKSSRIKPGDTLIEPTSGNTGIGIALAAAIKGYRCIICLPEKMSMEKIYVLKALGAEIVRTPTEAAFDAPDSHISVARRMQKEIKNSHILDQYTNPSNPLAHYDGTAEELIFQTEGKIDMLVAGAGTGGTITGIAKKLKEKIPNCEIVGVDPVGSILAQPESLNDYHRLQGYSIEGIGYDFIPEVLDRSMVDTWVKSNDKESMVMMRRMIRDEGLLCGGSCGAAMSCAIEAARTLKKGQTCVVVLPDSVRNYMTKALSDDWMIDNGFVDGDVIKNKKYSAWWASKPLSVLEMVSPLTVQNDVTVKDAIKLLHSEGFDMVPVVGADGSIEGVITEGGMSSKLISGRVTPDSLVHEVVYKAFRSISPTRTLSDLAAIFDHEPYALVTASSRMFSKDGEIKAVTVVSGIVTRIDLLNYIAKGEEEDSAEEQNEG